MIAWIQIAALAASAISTGIKASKDKKNRDAMGRSQQEAAVAQNKANLVANNPYKGGGYNQTLPSIMNLSGGARQPLGFTATQNAQMQQNYTKNYLSANNPYRGGGRSIMQMGSGLG